MRTIFMGAPPFAVPALDTLASLGVNVVAVYTKAPKPAGRRGLELTKTAVHSKAEELGLAVFTPASLRNDVELERFRSFAADIAVVAAYGLILPVGALSAPRLGCVNLHASLLPRWRGAAPIQRAIMAGDAETGIGLMQMEEGLDTGPVGREIRAPIHPSDTSGDLTTRLSELAASLLRESWDELKDGRLFFRGQPVEGVTYARKIEKTETPINWSLNCVAVRNHIHGLSPAPGAYSEIQIGATRERIKFLRVEVVEGQGAPGTILGSDFLVACGKGAIRVVEAQRAGKGPMSGADILRGGKPKTGDRFLSAEALRSVERSPS